MKRLAMLMTAMCAAGALAMPTKDELAKAQSLVAELMAEDVAAYKAKSKKAEEIGDMSVKYAQEASTEAAKFLLLKGAISYYVRGESYDKAADAVNALREAVPDVPPDVLEEIIRKNTVRVTAKKAPRLYAMYQTVQVQVAAAKEVKVAKAALAKKSKDEAAIRKLAEAQALSGDWKTALGTFAQMGNKVGAMAKSETDGKGLAAVADFWWAYESYLGEDDADAFKIHAAAIYRKCLADGLIDGLKKNIVEKRIKGYGESVAVVTNKLTVGGSPQNSCLNGKTTSNSSAQSRKGMALSLSKKVAIEFVPCPAGSFMMGRKGDEAAFSGTRYHKVNITRKFWMSKCKITKAQWEAVEPPTCAEWYKPEAQEKIGNLPAYNMSYSRVCTFCDHVNKMVGSKLPRGYVVRLPTEAEWEYALTAGCTDPNDPYLLCRDGNKEERTRARSEICVAPVTVKEKLMPLAVGWIQKKGEWDRLRYYVGTRKPNNWGIYDMLSNGSEYMLDTFWRPSREEYTMSTPTQRGLMYEEEETDPLRVYVPEGEKAVACMIRGGGDNNKFDGDWFRKKTLSTFAGYVGSGFHLVIGPDLVSEWKAKNGKK